MKPQNRTVLIIDNSPEDCAELRRLLLAGSEIRYEFLESDLGMTGTRLCQEAPSGTPDIILLDYYLPDINAPDILAALCAGSELPPCPIVVFTGSDPTIGRELLRAGAQDYLDKGTLSAQSLTRAVENSIDRFALLTELRQVEIVRHQNTDLFSRLVEQAPTGVYVIDSTFRFQQINALAAPIFRTISPLIGRDFAEVAQILWGAEVGAQLAQIFRNTLVTGERHISPRFIEQRRDINAEQAYEWETQRVTLANGQYGVVCYFHEITDRDRAERAMRESDERTRLAMEAASVGIWEWNLLTNNIHWDDEMFRIYGIPPTQDGFVPYSTWSEFVLADELPELERILQDTIQRQGNSRREFRIQRRDSGEHRSIETVETVRTDSNGKAIWVLGTNLDISERRQAERKIADLNTRLQRAIAESHHRIKNHLQILAALVDIQIGEGETVPRSAMVRVNQHIRSLAVLHDLLTTTQFGSDTDTISMREALREQLVMFQALVGGRQIVAEVEEISVSLKQAGTLLLLVNELLSNAIKHGSGDIMLRFCTEQDTILLEICDDGPGFSANFDPQKMANTGLELIESLSRWDLKGETSYENRVEGGARVSISLPIPHDPMEKLAES